MSHSIDEVSPENLYFTLEHVFLPKYGKEFLSDLIPIVTKLLESFETLQKSNTHLLEEVSALRQDNEELQFTIEVERQSRKKADKRYLETDDYCSVLKIKTSQKIDSLNSDNRALKNKIAFLEELVTRIEEREQVKEKEFASLHQRYTQLMKCSVKKAELEADINLTESINEVLNIQDKLHFHYKKQPRTTVSTDSGCVSQFSSPLKKLVHSQQDEDDYELVLASDVLTDDEVDELPYDSQMLSEIQHLIDDNRELEDTKRALNILKDDLLIKIEGLSRENEKLHEELRKSFDIREMLDEELKLLSSQQKNSPLENTNVPGSESPEYSINFTDLENSCLDNEQTSAFVVEEESRNREFTRREMARLIKERTYYKMKWMELKDSIQTMESLKAERFTYRTGLDKEKSPSPLRNFKESVIRGVGSITNKVHGYFENQSKDFTDQVAHEDELPTTSRRTQATNSNSSSPPPNRLWEFLESLLIAKSDSNS